MGFGSYQDAINILKNLRAELYKDQYFQKCKTIAECIMVLEDAWADEESAFARQCIELEERDVIHERGEFRLINGGKS